MSNRKPLVPSTYRHSERMTDTLPVTVTVPPYSYNSHVRN